MIRRGVPLIALLRQGWWWLTGVTIPDAEIISSVALDGSWNTSESLAGEWDTTADLDGAWDTTVTLDGSIA